MTGLTATGRLAGRRIVLTGGASGIGRATAELFAREGAGLLLLDRDGQGLAATAEATGAHVREVDVTDPAAVEGAVREGAVAMGGIDGLVNVAGIHHRGSVAETDADEFRRVVDVNLVGPYVLVRGCLPWLAEAPDATIVNVGSGQGLLPDAPERTAYAASKGGVVALTRAMAAEFGASIRVNAVCPGLVQTPMVEGVEQNAVRYALKRLAQPREIAEAILFLTSTASSYVTGSALAVDGGRTFH